MSVEETKQKLAKAIADGQGDMARNLIKMQSIALYEVAGQLSTVEEEDFKVALRDTLEAILIAEATILLAIDAVLARAGAD